MIGERFNMEDVFFRDLTVCVLDTLEGQIRWVNRFSSGDFPVEVPFFYSLTGDERFLLDTFQDDIVSENRFVELNTDVIPRGHITMKSFNITSDEFANPNVWLKMVVENEFEIRKILAKVRAVPIVVDYDLTILLSNEIDTFKCSQAIMDTLWIYKFMYFEHNFMNIDAVMLLPDTNQIEINREKNLTSDNTIKLTVSFQVQTYYPAFRKDRVNPTGYPRYYGDGMTDMNGYNLTGGFSDYFSGVANSGNPFDPISASNNPSIPNGPIVSRPIGSVDNSVGVSGGISTGNTSPVGGVSPGPPIRPNSPFVGISRPPILPDGYPAGSPFPRPPINPVFPSSVSGRPVWQNNGINGGLSGATFSISSGLNTSGTNNTSGIGGNVNTSTSPWGGDSPTGAVPSEDPNYYMYAPKRTKWFGNILRARQRSSTPILNPNSGNPNRTNGPN
jgi:hypothetical protein